MILLFVFMFLIILVISIKYYETFTTNEEEEISTQEVETVQLPKKLGSYTGKYQCLDDSLKYMNTYHSDLGNFSNKIDKSSDNFLRHRKVNKIITNIPDNKKKLTPINVFETLNYNKALLHAAQLQNFEDRYLYKANERINY